MDMDTKKMTQQVRLSHWSGIMRERKESGQSIRSWCQEKGINEKTFHYWQQKLRKAACEQFVETKAASETSLAPLRFAEVRVEEPLSTTGVKETPGQLHVEVGGARITAQSEYPPDKLAALLRELMRPC